MWKCREPGDFPWAGRWSETEIIFVTAHAEHAAKAFDIKALDYLLKPLRPERLAEALTRARDFFSKRYTATAGKSLVLRDGRKDVVVGTEDIVALEAEGGLHAVSFPRGGFHAGRGEYRRV